MAYALVSILLGQLGFIIQQELEQEVRLVVGVRKDIQQMSTTLKSIQSVLDDAEEKQYKNESLKVWLDQLKNAAYDMEDVLEEWITEILRSELEGVDNAQIPKNKVCSYLFSLCNCFGQVSLRHDIGHKIKELKARLDVIAIEKDKYHLNTTGRIEEPSRPMTSSVIDVLEVCGRTQDKETLVSKLLSESSRQEIDVPIISIVGLGGLGKTTLAQIIYNDDRVKNYFEKRMWICVSEPFDQIRLAKAIIKAIGENVPDDIEWDPLHQHLCNVVRGKQFLLVLDDVWIEDRTKWSPLKHSLNRGAQGSRIVVTTRNNRVAKMISSTYTHDLAQLSMEDCWLIFSRIAFQGRREEDCEKLEEIGKEITKKCKGVPLFAKTLGGLMLFKSTRLEWKQVLDNDAWKLPDVEKGVLPAFLLSYYALPSHVKCCFTYCSTFPKDSEIYKDDLIKLWMAQGFLSTSGRRELEVVGAEYFDNLAMCSFFQDFERDGDGNIIYCKMHDLVHDFAQFLTNTECSIINGDNLEFNTTEFVRHLNVQNLDSDSTLLSIYKVKNLRTLIIDGWAPLQVPTLSDLFYRLTCLRALSLGIRNLEELPNEVEKLIHLRYLDLSNTNLMELPETMSKLFNLQTLRLASCWRLCKLPEEIWKMINLRHLEIKDTGALNYMPQGVGKLRSLRTLHKFIVGGVSRGGCKIGELKDLNLLQGDLEISGLERMSDGNEASEAKLKDKQYLYGLVLKFDNVAEGEIEKMVRVLKGLQPHRNLEKLRIHNYSGCKFPCWMVDSMLPNLLTVELSDCSKCVQFPPLGRFPYLQNLDITGMDGIIKFTGKDFGGIVGNDGFVKVFPKLKELSIGDMANLEEWNFRGEDGEIIMPYLNILKLWNFPKLQVLPAVGNLSVLVQLYISRMKTVKRVGLEFLGIVDVGSTKRRDHTLVVFPHLEILEFWNMSEWEEWEMLESEDNEEIAVIMPRLHSLSLYDCPKLKELPLQLFPATLKKLTIENCLKLNWTCCLPPHLEELILIDDAGVLSRSLPIDGTSNHLKALRIFSSKHSSLPEGLAHLTSLQHLEINMIDFLRCMPEELRHLTLIQHLTISDCPNLGPRCRKEVGEDWSIISHIPFISINGEMQ